MFTPTCIPKHLFTIETAKNSFHFIICSIQEILVQKLLVWSKQRHQEAGFREPFIILKISVCRIPSYCLKRFPFKGDRCHHCLRDHAHEVTQNGLVMLKTDSLIWIDIACSL